MTESENTPSSGNARKSRPRANAARKTRKAAPKRKSAAGAASRQVKALRAMLSEASKTANRAGARIASISRDGSAATRKALGSAGKATRRAVQSSVREWKKLDTPRKVEFVAALLSALATASGAISRGRKKKKLSARAGSLLRKALR